MKSHEFRKPIAQVQTEQRQAIYQQHKVAKQPTLLRTGLAVGVGLAFMALAKMINSK